jgi:fructose-1,6-bisphosphatase/inositol monophosphatase family enzyme
MPALGEMVFATAGAGAFVQVDGREPVPARVSSASSLGESLLCTTSFDYFRRTSSVPAMVALCEAFGSTRGWSDCYAHVLVATGRADACVEPVLQPWDIAATIPIIEEAGGRCTDFGGRVNAFAPNGVLSNGRIHDAVVAVLNEARSS